jgi:hypothetical protein
MSGFDGVVLRVERGQWTESFLPRCLRCEWAAGWPHLGECRAVMSVRKHLERIHKIGDPDIAVVRYIGKDGSL